MRAVFLRAPETGGGGPLQPEPETETGQGPDTGADDVVEKTDMAVLEGAVSDLYLEFDDNRLLPLLFGERDEHLLRLERALGVSIVSRGNVVVVSGAESAARIARETLEGLYQRLEQGRTVDSAEIDAMIRRKQAAASSAAAEDVWRDAETVIRTRKRHIAPRTAHQASYIKALEENGLVFALGPAGTGKTYLAVAVAVSKLLGGQVERIILSRPAVEAGERLGFLPGDLREKVDPYLRPLYDALYDMLPGDQVVRRLSNGDIEIAPLAFMRGRTLSNAFVILDEAQNTTPMQMKMFLTRLGENSAMVVTGDLSQVDLPPGARSGLTDALEALAGVDGVGVVRFTDSDVLRHQLVTRIVQAYDRRDREANSASGRGPKA